MPKRDQFFADLAADNRQAALLVAQVGAAPQELQLITQIAEYDETAEGLRPIRSYIIRVLGAIEHQINNFGVTTDHIQLTDNHPLLAVYTETPTAVFFRGEPTNPDALALDIAQAHASTFYPYRHFPEYLNMEQPLGTLLSSGGGLLGQMPQSLANSLLKVLDHHGLETKTAEGKPYINVHDNPALLNQQLQALIFGSSYFISYAFSFEEMRSRQPKS